MGRRFLSFLGKGTNPALLHSLEEGSNTLADLGEDFAAILLERRKRPNTLIGITCFFEETETSKVLGVVRCANSNSDRGVD